MLNGFLVVYIIYIYIYTHLREEGMQSMYCNASSGLPS